MDKEDKMRKTITKVVLIICAVSVALGIALCASGVVMGADVEKALRGIGINVETRIEPNNMYDDYMQMPPEDQRCGHNIVAYKIDRKE